MPNYELLTIGVIHTLVQNVIYTLPTRAVYVFSSGILELSNDASTWTAIGTTNPVAAVYIRNTAADAPISLKAA